MLRNNCNAITRNRNLQSACTCNPASGVGSAVDSSVDSGDSSDEVVVVVPVSTALVDSAAFVVADSSGRRVPVSALSGDLRQEVSMSSIYGAVRANSPFRIPPFRLKKE